MIKKSTMFGFPKSGNSLLHAILRVIYEQTEGGYSSVLDRKHRYFLFEGYDRVDDIASEGGVWVTRKGNGEEKEVGLKLLKNSSVIWCHDVVTEKHINDLIGSERVGFYLQRDPKSVLLSLAHHTTRLAGHIKGYEITDPREVIADSNIIIRWLDRWKAHTDAIQGIQELTIIQYDDLAGSNKHLEVEKLCNVIGIKSDKKIVQAVLTQTSKHKMSIESSEHIGGRDYRIGFSTDVERVIDEFLDQHL